MSRFISNTKKGLFTEKEIKSLVIDQYKEFPYPTEMPLSQYLEADKFSKSPGDPIEMAIFAQFDPSKKSNILCAGAGTGDFTVHLAYFLKKNNWPSGNTRIIHLDLSDSSIEIARNRARQLGVEDRIEFINDNIDNVSSLKTKFDFIQCCGVLHHQVDPDKTLKILSDNLTEHGSIGIMVYGTKGRNGVYEVQNLVKNLSDDDMSNKDRLNLAVDIINSLPSNHFIKNNKFLNLNTSPTEIIDIFCNYKDRSYTVPEVYDFCNKAGLTFVRMLENCSKTFASDRNIPSKLKQKIENLNRREQEELFEDWYCSKKKQIFYGSKSKFKTFVFEEDKICLVAESILGFYKSSLTNFSSININNHDIGLNIEFPPVTSWYLIREIDNARSAKEVIERVKTSNPHLNSNLLAKDLEVVMKTFYDICLGGMSDYPCYNSNIETN